MFLSLVLVAAGMVVSLMMRPIGESGSLGAVIDGVESIAASVGPGERYAWDNLSVPVVLERGGADGVLFGRTRVHRDDGSHLHVSAFDGQSLERLWVTPSLGTWSGDDAYRRVHVLVAGERVIYSDSRAGLTVADPTTGETTHHLTLSDVAERICPGASAEEVWVQVADEQHVVVDVATGRSSPAADPGTCPPDRRPSPDCRGFFAPDGWALTATCLPEKAAPRQAGFEAERVLRHGDDAVAVGVRRPGTEVPMALGFDPHSASVLWSRTLPAGDPQRAKAESAALTDLHTGTLVATYTQRDDSRRLIAIDARTGDTLWDVAVPRSQDGSEERAMVVTATRVYVPHWTWLEVIDRANGAHLGTIGSW